MTSPPVLLSEQRRTTLLAEKAAIEAEELTARAELQKQRERRERDLRERGRDVASRLLSFARIEELARRAENPMMFVLAEQHAPIGLLEVPDFAGLGAHDRLQVLQGVRDAYRSLVGDE